MKMSLSDPKNHIPPFLLIIISFVVYQTTISPVVFLGDSGELTAAAFSLGIPHGNGYPLYALLGKLFCLIPIGNVGFRMNLMSTFFAVATLWLVYGLIVRITASKLAAFVVTLILAFVSEFWFQAVAAEVYALHVFFVVLMIRLLWWWNEKREFECLTLLVFVTGISFGNHLQTVMLAPAVLFMIISGDKKTLFAPKNVIILSAVFVVALSMYLYLPIRTEAGAAIHWGDPNSLGRFWADVSGKSHRAGYVLNKSPLEYLLRTKEALGFVWSQFGVVILFSLWGWIKLSSVRWRFFFVLVVVFDFIYTVFLNTISLEITPFELSTYVVLSLLAGIGMADLIRRAGNLSSISAGTQRLIRTAFVVIPIVFLMMNYSLCNQRRNYTAYEHALNIFRTTGRGDILIMQGDNNLFPVIYGRMVERMREDLLLFDRFNVVFKLPYLGKKNGQYFGKWDGFRVLLEENLLKRMSDNEIYYVIFDPESVFLPSEYTLVPFGMLHRVAKKEELRNPYKIRNLWKYYSTESFHDSFERDYHSRQVGAHFLLRQGQYLFMAGKHEEGFEFVKKASRMGYDDAGIHASLSIFLVDQGLFHAARAELKKCEHYYEDPSIPQNNWGIYYYRRGEYAEAVTRFEEAIRIRPQVFSYYKNLGYALYELGKDKEAVHAFEKSLAINVDQPEIEDFMKENGLKK